MRKENNSKYRLICLAVITAMTLAGIIALQVYWLNTSYEQQRSRFTDDIENALVETSVKSQLFAALPKSGMNKEDSLLAYSLPGIITNIIGKIPVSMISQLQTNKTVTINRAMAINVNGTKKPHSGIQYFMDNLERNADSIDVKTDTSKAAFSKVSLSVYRQIFATELANRSIYTPFQLAILDSLGHFQTATCDTSVFKQISTKSVPDLSTQLLPNGCSLQVAFPNANLYLVKRMAWLLSVTALLIIICCISFSYMVMLFFRQKRLSDIRNDFLNNMTHELKTPISSVSVALELMQDSRHPVSEEAKKEYFAIAQGELKRLTMLVEKVLKMAAFEKSEIKVAPESFLATTWLQDIISSLRPMFETKGAEVSISVKPELFMLYADKTHLTNVLQNLLENAIKYNDKELPAIEVIIYESGDHTTIQVADNGKGIPPSYIDKVFDKFFRVPSGDRHDIKGYGLGLSYVKAVVELHHGTVTVNSKEKEGSTFTIQLPAKKID